MAPACTLRQLVRFCTSTDGTRIAYSTVGSGPPLVKAANWLNPLEYRVGEPGVEAPDRQIDQTRHAPRYDSK